MYSKLVRNMSDGNFMMHFVVGVVAAVVVVVVVVEGRCTGVFLGI